jgi:hypothetical protein
MQIGSDFVLCVDLQPKDAVMVQINPLAQENNANTHPQIHSELRFAFFHGKSSKQR